MKKLISPLLCLLLIFALAVPALADVIWEPEDDFYWQHYDACILTRADYEARTDAPIQESPDTPTVRGTVPAGSTTYVYYRWEDWGYVNVSYGEGWVDLSLFRRLYNSDDFVDRHAEEIVQEDGSVSRAENDIIYFWTFPHSGVVADRIDADAFSWAEDDPAYYALWTDEDGLRWGHVNYYYGMGGWICLDAPGADDLPADGPRYAEDGIDTLPAGEAALLSDARTAVRTACLITAAVAVIAAAAIPLVLKKKRNETDA